MPVVLVRTEGLVVTSSTHTTVPANQDSTDLTVRQVRVFTLCSIYFVCILHQNKQWLKACVIYTYTRVYVSMGPYIA